MNSWILASVASYQDSNVLYFFCASTVKMKQIFRFSCSCRHLSTVTLQNAQLIEIHSALVLETKVALRSRCFVTKSVLGIYVEIFLVINAEWMFS